VISFLEANHGVKTMSARIDIARNVAGHLFATEEAIDTAIASAAGLVGYMPTARQQARVSAEVGQEAFEQIIATMSTLGEARRKIVAAHQLLAESSAQARIPVQNFGGFVNKPSHQVRAGLQVVATRQTG
jgi:hypothetical protein